MVSERDRARMRRIAAAMDELNRDAVAEAARRSPGENIEIGLRLGDAALAIAQPAGARPPDVPPIWRWRELQRRRRAKA